MVDFPIEDIIWTPDCIDDLVCTLTISLWVLL